MGRREQQPPKCRDFPKPAVVVISGPCYCVASCLLVLHEQHFVYFVVICVGVAVFVGGVCIIMFCNTCSRETLLSLLQLDKCCIKSAQYGQRKDVFSYR